MGAGQLCPMESGVRILLAGSVDCNCSHPFGRCRECSLNRKIVCTSPPLEWCDFGEHCDAGGGGRRQDATRQMTYGMRGLQLRQRHAVCTYLELVDDLRRREVLASIGPPFLGLRSSSHVSVKRIPL